MIFNCTNECYQILNCKLKMDAMQVLMSLHTNNHRYRQLTVNDLTGWEPFSLIYICSQNNNHSLAILVEFCLIGQALQCARTYCLRCYACTRMYDQQIYACARTYMVHCAMLLLELMVSSIMVRSCI
jgi:hypothetical protein